MKTIKERYKLTHLARKHGSKINTRQKTIYVKYGDTIPPPSKEESDLIEKFNYVRQLEIRF